MGILFSLSLRISIESVVANRKRAHCNELNICEFIRTFQIELGKFICIMY